MSAVLIAYGSLTFKSLTTYIYVVPQG